MRNHTPIRIEEFNGMWRRGDTETTPADHFSDCRNIQFIQSGFKTRDGIEPLLDYGQVVRIYNFIQESGESLLILCNDGNLYDSAFPGPPILSIPLMSDFAYVSIGGRAYISPHDGVKGLQNEFVYVYLGDGTPARKAAGNPPIDAHNIITAANSGSAGNVEIGTHILGVVYETNTGFLSAVGPVTKATVVAPGHESINITLLPISPDVGIVTKLHIVSTKAINPALYNGNTSGYAFYFIPGAVVANGVTTLTVSFFDSELLESAEHLQDLFNEIPACVNLTTYHGRMVCVNSYNDISLLRLSHPGEPEAINEIDGLIVIPLDGTPLTTAQEFRDVLYAYKQIRTFAIVDNGDVPSSWTVTILDAGVGCSVHGIGTVLDSGGVNIDFLILVDYSGVMLFNGVYTRPELSWKIKDFWMIQTRDAFKEISTINDSLSQILYITLPDKQILIGDYSNGLDAKNIRWAIWELAVKASTITLTETNKLIIGSNP